MAEPARAKGPAATWPIRVSASGAPVPVTTTAAISDSVVFTVSPPATIYLWTYDPDGTLANIFAGQTGNYITLVSGANPAVQFNTNVVSVGDTCTFVPNTTIPPAEHHQKERGPRDVAGVKGYINITQ